MSVSNAAGPLAVVVAAAAALWWVQDRSGRREGRAVLEDAQAAQRRMRQDYQDMSALSRRLLEVQETERRTVATELYDEIGQCLSAVRLQFTQLRRATRDERMLEPLQSAERMADRGLERIRALAVLLHPPQLETLGLEAAIRWHLDARSATTGLPIAFTCEGLDHEPARPVAITAFRIVEEAVANAVHHAQAPHVDVRVRPYADGLRLEIEDAGRGFVFAGGDAAGGHRPQPGLLAMQERAHAVGGRVTVRSAPGAGTCVSATLPWR